MKKIVLAGLLAASSLVMADDYDPFIGAGMVMSRVELGSGETTGHKTGVNLRAGFAAENNRIFLTFDSVDSDLGTINMLAANLEGTSSPYRLAGWLATRFFIGGHIGASDIDGDYGAIGGAQAGILFDLPANFSVEFGGKYTWSEEDEVNNIESVFTALNYQF